jgi:dTMP kinase
MKGLFITIYGINNLGKSTQAQLLVDRMNAEGHRTQYVKYPVYDLPSGSMINTYLREGNPDELSAREIQIIYALNRSAYEPTLKQTLESGVHVVAEDYTGSGLSWGVGSGVPKPFMEKINCHLLKEDIAFHFDGERFSSGIEKSHKHEQDEALQQHVRQAYNMFGKKHGWITVNANQEKQVVQEDIWKIVSNKLSTHAL